MRLSPTIRLRLTLWYGGLFLLAGFVLLTANFLLVARDFPSGRADLREAVAARLDVPADELRPGRVIPLESRRPDRPAGFPVSDLVDEVGAEIKSDTLEQLAIQSALALAAMAVASMGLGWVVAGRMLRPLHEIAGTVHRISDQNLGERVALDGPADELMELADQFDVMLDRLQAAFETQREFVANASHELRTPLTVIRTELDVTLADRQATAAELDEMAGVMRRAIDRTERLIDQFLILARADEPAQRTDDVDLADAVRRALDARWAEADALDLRRELSLAPAAMRGDPVLIDRLVGNLVDNAVQHNEPGGWVSIATEQSADGVTIQIANGGPRIPEDEVPRLFDRFARRDRSRSRETGGYGLGLSIVRSIARRHGGSVSAQARGDGGLTVTVHLPA